MQDEQQITAEQVIDLCYEAFKFRENAYGQPASIQLERLLNEASAACTKYVEQQLAKTTNHIDYFG